MTDPHSSGRFLTSSWAVWLTVDFRKAVSCVMWVSTTNKPVYFCTAKRLQNLTFLIFYVAGASLLCLRNACATQKLWSACNITNSIPISGKCWAYSPAFVGAALPQKMFLLYFWTFTGATNQWSKNYYKPLYVCNFEIAHKVVLFHETVDQYQCTYSPSRGTACICFDKGLIVVMSIRSSWADWGIIENQAEWEPAQAWRTDAPTSSIWEIITVCRPIRSHDAH